MIRCRSTVTVVPGATPFRSDGVTPMKNVLCVSCFSDTAVGALPADYYDGELALEGVTRTDPETFTIPGAGMMQVQVENDN